MESPDEATKRLAQGTLEVGWKFSWFAKIYFQ